MAEKATKESIGREVADAEWTAKYFLAYLA
jgi:hypothetical protein